jgi:hypothetical protein
MAELESAVVLHGDHVEPAVMAAQRVALPDGFTGDAAALRSAARAWMDDVHEYCTSTRYLDRLDRERVRFNRNVRAFRRSHRWLADDLGPDDRFGYLHPTDGSVVFHGMRRGPAGERVLFVANMEGRPVDLVAAELPGAEGGAWVPALTAPGLPEVDATASITLSDAMGIVFIDAPT